MALADRIKKENREVLRVIRGINRRLNRIEARTKRKYIEKLTILFIFSKSVGTYKAMQRLIQNGYDGDAYVLMRSLFENFVNAKYIEQSPYPRAKIFLDFDWLVRHQLMTTLEKDQASSMTQSTSTKKNTAQEIRGNYRNAIQHRRYHGIKTKLNWSGKSIREMADAIQLSKMYKQVYKLSSQYVHGTSSSSHSYFRINKLGHLSIKQPVPKKMTKSLAAISSVSNVCMIGLCDLMNDVFVIGMDKELQSGLKVLQSYN